jgi:RNA polymerase sigma-70 factor (ECF subfamily)
MTSEDQRRNASEEELVEDFRSTGDNECFDRLYRSTRRKVFSVCLKFLREPGAAEDVVHEAFLRAYERFHSMEGRNFSAWVCRIAANLCMNRIRDQRRREELMSAAHQLQLAAALPEVETIQAEQKQMVLDVIESLGPEQRRVFLLRHVENCSYQEIERITGYDSGQVRSHLQNARRNFQLRWRRKTGAGVGDEPGRV